LRQSAVSLFCRIRDAEIAAHFDTYLPNFTHRLVIYIDHVIRIEEAATCNLRTGGDDKYVQSFIAEASWKMSIWKTKKKKEDTIKCILGRQYMSMGCGSNRLIIASISGFFFVFLVLVLGSQVL
jgi:hypothetical protein